MVRVDPDAALGGSSADASRRVGAVDADAGKLSGGETEEVGTIASLHLSAVASFVNPVCAFVDAHDAESAFGRPIVSMFFLVSFFRTTGDAAGEEHAVFSVHDVEAHFGFGNIDIRSFRSAQHGGVHAVRVFHLGQCFDLVFRCFGKGVGQFLQRFFVNVRFFLRAAEKNRNEKNRETIYNMYRLTCEHVGRSARFRLLSRVELLPTLCAGVLKCEFRLQRWHFIFTLKRITAPKRLFSPCFLTFLCAFNAVLVSEARFFEER